MNFSKTASYSLNVLSYMAAHDGTSMSASYLHDELKIPYPYLRQVLANLSKSGFIRSERGRSGGFTFSMPMNRIFLSEIIDSTDGLDGFNRCILGFSECPFSTPCSMHSIWEETRTNILGILKKTSLADIAANRV